MTGETWEDELLEPLEPGDGLDWNRNRLGVRIERVFEICRLLGQAEMTIPEVAVATGVTVRHARRYIYAIHLAGLDVLVRRTGSPHGPSVTYRLDRRSWDGHLHLPRT